MRLKRDDTDKEDLYLLVQTDEHPIDLNHCQKWRSLQHKLPRNLATSAVCLSRTVKIPRVLSEARVMHLEVDCARRIYAQ